MDTILKTVIGKVVSPPLYQCHYFEDIVSEISHQFYFFVCEVIDWVLHFLGGMIDDFGINSRMRDDKVN